MKNTSQKNIYLPFLPANRIAVTIYPYIFWSKKKQGWQRQDVIIHETYHWNEQKQWKQGKLFGLTRWLIKYIVFWFCFNVLRGKNRGEHPMEKPAYKAQQAYLDMI